MERVKRIFRIEVISLVFSVGWGVLAAADWPQWRGPDGNGVSNETGLAFRWNESEGLKWKTELPQWGTSTPAIRGSALFLTSHTDDGKLLVLRLDAATGEIDWTRQIGIGKPVLGVEASGKGVFK